MTKAKKWKYEFIFILPSDLEKQEQALLLKQAGEVIAKAGGEVIKQVDWGLKPFSYSIKDQLGGRYFIWEVYFAKTPILKEINLFFNRENKILRYLWKGEKNG
ncbi:30S ribosomal protein S6 [Candidatus Shapirobacteria bacterium]|nr:30S ribosomal protein S6 [Candidatus Shapirobacteria bacterium]